jgi:hypothetical protein
MKCPRLTRSRLRLSRLRNALALDRLEEAECWKQECWNTVRLMHSMSTGFSHPGPLHVTYHSRYTYYIFTTAPRYITSIILVWYLHSLNTHLTHHTFTFSCFLASTHSHTLYKLITTPPCQPRWEKLLVFLRFDAEDYYYYYLRDFMKMKLNFEKSECQVKVGSFEDLMQIVPNQCPTFRNTALVVQVN